MSRPSYPAMTAADRIATLLGVAYEWSNPADFLGEIAGELRAAGYPDPGSTDSVAHYRRQADRLGIPYEVYEDDEPDDEPEEGDEARCTCGFDLVYGDGEWQHDAAPWRWGDDHPANPVVSS